MSHPLLLLSAITIAQICRPPFHLSETQIPANNESHKGAPDRAPLLGVGAILLQIRRRHVDVGNRKGTVISRWTGVALPRPSTNSLLPPSLLLRRRRHQASPSRWMPSKESRCHRPQPTHKETLRVRSRQRPTGQEGIGTNINRSHKIIRTLPRSLVVHPTCKCLGVLPIPFTAAVDLSPPEVNVAQHHDILLLHRTATLPHIPPTAIRLRENHGQGRPASRNSMTLPRSRKLQSTRVCNGQSPYIRLDEI